MIATRRRIQRLEGLSRLIVICLVALLPAVASAASLPPLDLNAYCRTAYGSSAYAVLQQYNAYGWACRLGTQNYGMDLSAACRQQYPTEGQYAAYQDYANPYSWYCVLGKTYTSFRGENFFLYAWKGRNVALQTPDPYCPVSVLLRILDALDRGYDYYRNAAPQAPAPYKTYGGLLSIAGLPYGRVSSCGDDKPACGMPGITGIELKYEVYTNLCDRVQFWNEYDQTSFYELGRNFWFYTDKIEYTGSDGASLSITTGFAIAMRFLSMDYAGVAGAPVNQLSYADLRRVTENIVDVYRDDPSLRWENTLKVGEGPPVFSPQRRGSDLFASMLLRLHRAHGTRFIQQLWRNVAIRNNRTNSYEAVDNFVAAASLAAGVNLTNLFMNTWKMPVSAAVQQELQSKLGAPVSPSPYL